MNVSEKEYLLKIEKSVGRTINKYSLIGSGEKVAVALSGGIDSLLLLETITLRRKRLPISYEVFAIHILTEKTGQQIDLDFLKNFCQKLSVPLFIEEAKFDLNTEKSVCFLCSWHRRKHIFDFAERMNCKKIAFGHNLDDAIETLIMNMSYNGTISSLPPKLSLFNGKVEIIRPPLMLTKEEIKQYADIQKFPQEYKECPYSKDNSREKARSIIKMMSQGDSKIKRNIFKSMQNIHKEYLP